MHFSLDPSVPERLDRLEQQLADIQALVTRTYEHHEDGAALVAEMRRAPDYDDAWAPDPLITVRIATYNRAGLLTDRALASVLRQTHPKWEAIVVGDACTDDTAERVAQIGDPRIRFENLPVRGPYPEGERARWLVAGSAPMNRAIELARGAWIATLDDDDEWLPDHLEALLAEARRTRAEVVYGKNSLRDTRNGRLINVQIGAWPPEKGSFTFQDAIYHSGLRRFRYDLNARFAGEPGDWNLARRMWSAGARFAFLDRLVTTVHFSPKQPDIRRWREEILRTRGYVDG
jgi:glycosyltransferase involved in cell wall biosynthesis